MVTVCWAAKGGSGTTVVAAGIALSVPAPTLLVDLSGDLPAALGAELHVRAGVADWLEGDTPSEHLADLVDELVPTRWLLPWHGTDDGTGREKGTHHRRWAAAAEDRWHDLADWLGRWERERSAAVVVDAGSGEPPAPLLTIARHRLLVTRPCYLSLRRAAVATARPSSVVLVQEPGRAYKVRDIEAALGTPVGAVVPYDPAVARAVDAGLLLARGRTAVAKSLRGLAA